MGFSQQSFNFFVYIHFEVIHKRFTTVESSSSGNGCGGNCDSSNSSTSRELPQCFSRGIFDDGGLIFILSLL